MRPLALLIITALALGRAPVTEAAMSDPATHATAEAALAAYDRDHDPAQLEAAADAAGRDDGMAPADPTAAQPAAHARLALWIEVLARFTRDLDPTFDPDKPPRTAVAPPEMGGAQLPPGADPSAIADPAQRAAYVAALEQTRQRQAAFAAQFKLQAMHDRLLHRAAASIQDAHATLGLTAAEAEPALIHGALLPADRAALRAALAG